MHLHDGELRAYLDRELDKTEMERASQHLSACPDCQSRLGVMQARIQKIQVQLDSLQPDPNRRRCLLRLPANAWRRSTINRKWRFYPC